MQHPPNQNLEQSIGNLDKRIENLKIQFTLFFSGELNVPPEKEREDIENQIRRLLAIEQKSAVIKILIQNIASKFSIYNNVWLKKLHESEIGVSLQVGKMVDAGKPREKTESEEKKIPVSLNSENSFERFFNEYQSLWAPSSEKSLDKDFVINSLKSKMITENLIDAEVYLALANGKVKVKVKK